MDSEFEIWQAGDATAQRRRLRAGTSNRLELPPEFFSDDRPVNFRGRTQVASNDWGGFSPPVQFWLNSFAPLAPDNVQILTPFPNPNGSIFIGWTHVRNPAMRDDEQTESQVQVRQDGGDWHTFPGGIYNMAEIPAGTFSTLAPVFVRASTRVGEDIWGEWSPEKEFELMETPPRAPVLTFPPPRPPGNSVTATNGVALRWSYNSPFDVFPSRFDIRYRIGDAETIESEEWVEVSTFSQCGLPAATTVTTRPEAMQKRLQWQVMAYGEAGDPGPWSDIARAFIIGVPQTPVVVDVTNSGRPQVTFSAQDAMAWEFEMAECDAFAEITYTTGERAFTGEFTHTAEKFIPNGNYFARLRISNEYGISSEWSTPFPFEISVAAPAAVKLTTANNLQFSTHLRFDGEGRTVYVYRAEIESGDFLRIARVEDANAFEDWTVRPGTRYKYFLRVVGENFGFADSNIETAKASFRETTIATADAPDNMLELLVQLGGKPTKNSQFSQEKTLTHFAGREKPVLQMGTHTSRDANLAFYVNLSDLERLEELAQSGQVLILRDWRLGVIFGTITGGIGGNAAGFGNHAQVSFSFTETDFPQEVEIL